MTTFAQRLAILWQLRKDIYVQIFVGLFILGHIPYFLPSVTAEQINIYPWILSSVVARQHDQPALGVGAMELEY